MAGFTIIVEVPIDALESPKSPYQWESQRRRGSGEGERERERDCESFQRSSKGIRLKVRSPHILRLSQIHTPDLEEGFPFRALKPFSSGLFKNRDFLVVSGFSFFTFLCFT